MAKYQPETVFRYAYHDCPSLATHITIP